MVRDRLDELRSKCNHVAYSDACIEIKPSKQDVEIMEQLERFSEIKTWIGSIRKNTEDMKKSISSAFHYNDRGIRDKVEGRIQNSVELCKKIHDAIKTLQSEIEVEAEQGSQTVTLFRIKHTQFLMIKDDYLSAYREHEAFISYYEEKIKKLINIEARAMSYNITDDEASELLVKNQSAFFVGNILEETENTRQALRGIMTRHTELENLEKSLIEIRDLFVRISTLVMEQGSLIQVVEYHAQRATLNIDKGAAQLDKARELKIKALKKKSCILIWVTVVLVILIFFIIVF